MAGLKNTMRRLGNAGRGKGYKTTDERHAEEAAARQAVKDKRYDEAAGSMPDDEQIKRNERRKAAKRRGSRVSTVLTDNETLGPG